MHETIFFAAPDQPDVAGLSSLEKAERDRRRGSAATQRPLRLMKNSSTRYDLIRYPSYTHPQTHPDRLAVIGSLFGLEPAAANRCRVLELGCGNGANLIPMAWSLPRSEFVGIDLAAEPVADGNKMLHGLGLTNIRLAAGSVTEVNADWGSFDYIIAHGLYSWVPPQVREHMLSICQTNLTPRGIAFISYNAMPGGHLRNMLRDMMLFHVRGFEAAEERIRQSLAFVRFLADAQDTEDDYRRWMKAESRRILEHDAGHLYHDELGELNEPLYFTQFMEQAARHGLQYLGEADYFEMSDHIFKDSVRATLEQLGSNRILREQYLDFLKCRRFRQTLLCRGDAPLSPGPLAKSVERLFISSAAAISVDPLAERTAAHFFFESPKGAKIETDFALGQSALKVLQEIWPQPLPFEELLQQATARLRPTSPSEADPSTGRDRLGEFLLQLYGAGIVAFRSEPSPFVLQAGDRPATSPVARWQAQRGEIVTSMFHVTVKVEDEIGRQLLTWLDGKHDRSALVDKLWLLLKSKHAVSATANDEPAARRKIESDLEKNLLKLGRLGLLMT